MLTVQPSLKCLVDRAYGDCTSTLAAVMATHTSALLTEVRCVCECVCVTASILVAVVAFPASARLCFLFAIAVIVCRRRVGCVTVR